MTVEKFNIIGDVAGRYDELLKLLKIMPEAPVIFVGDLIDRGSQGKQVIEWAMKNAHESVLGNHEQMMIDAHNDYRKDIWLYNGGYSTLDSYGVKLCKDLPTDHIEWLRNRPIKFESEGLLVTHGPWSKLVSKEVAFNKDSPIMSVLWNRDPPKKRKMFQVFGHNTVTTTYDDYAICIDNSGNRELMGLHWPTKELFKVDYLKENV